MALFFVGSRVPRPPERPAHAGRPPEVVLLHPQGVASEEPPEGVPRYDVPVGLRGEGDGAAGLARQEVVDGVPDLDGLMRKKSTEFHVNWVFVQAKTYDATDRRIKFNVISICPECIILEQNVYRVL